MSLFKLTPEQDEAVNHNKGNLQIIACAGSGKTEVVSRRIAKLIESGTKPRTIVAFTFTEKAAEELKSRIREILEKTCPDRADIGDMYVGTIHSFCFETLKELEPRYRGFDVLDDPKRYAFLSAPTRWYRSHLQVYGDSGKFNTLSKFFRSCDIVKMEDIDVSQVSDEDFVEAFHRYEGFLEDERYLDFTSMIYRLVKLLEDDRDIKNRLNEKVKHLVVDEYQDVNVIQEKLIRHIGEGCESLCVVGDDDQCIYNWRGSTVENIIDFEDNYPNVTRKPIETNFRSTEMVIDCAKKFIKFSRHRLEKEIKPKEEPVNHSENGDLFYRQFDTDDDELQFVTKRIKDLMGTDCHNKKGEPFALSYGDFAILTRKRWHAAKIVPYLEEAGIPFILDVGDQVFDRPELQLGLRCLSYVFGLPFNYQPVTLTALSELYVTVFEERQLNGKPAYPEADVNQFLEMLNRVHDEIKEIEKKGDRDYLPDGLQPFYHKILSAFGGVIYDFDPVYNYNFAVLSKAIADYESVWIRLRASQVKYFFGFIRAYGQYAYADQSHNDPTLIDAVKVLTIHRAKGLEFPVVFLPEFVKESTPRRETTFIDEHLYDVEKYAGTEEDERRVYYTAITRTMKYLFLTCSKKRRKSDGSYYLRPSIFEPDPFLNQIVSCGSFTDDVTIFRPSSGHMPRKNSSQMFPTSYSDINTYRRCGHDYLLRNIYGYQAGVPPAFGYGTRIHNILNIIYNEYITSGRIPSIQDVETLFEQHFFLRYAPDRLTENMKKGGIEVVRNYIDINKDDFSKVLETEKKFELVHDEALISGVIDLLKKMDEQGNVEEVEVVDFKAEKEDSDLYARDYELQLRLYALACLRSLGLSPKKATVHRLDARKGEEKRLEVDISESALKEASREISESILGIVEKKFAPRRHNACGDCDWLRICPHQTAP